MSLFFKRLNFEKKYYFIRFKSISYTKYQSIFQL